MTTTDAVITMALETRAINGREQAIVREMVEVPYDVNGTMGPRVRMKKTKDQVIRQ